MIGCLPKQLNINGTDRAIRSDFRVALLIFQAFNDADLDIREKYQVMLECLYEDYNSIIQDDLEEALKMAVWFLDGGNDSNNEYTPIKSKKVMDWEQDEQIIFSAINKVAGFETRSTEYLHWWTFLGFFNEIGEGLLTTIINIRQKKNKNKKLEKHEQEFYKENKQLIDFKIKHTKEEQQEIDFINNLLNH
jgi:hypothetical protein